MGKDPPPSRDTWRDGAITKDYNHGYIFVSVYVIIFQCGGSGYIYVSMLMCISLYSSVVAVGTYMLVC